jgi:hypothetical protein
MTMSLDVKLRQEIFSANITHNLGKMASEAGIYQALWRPEELNYYSARELITPLTKGLALLAAEPERFKKFNSPNGWGMYEHFVPFVAKYLLACIENPEAAVSASR